VRSYWPKKIGAGENSIETKHAFMKTNLRNLLVVGIASCLFTGCCTTQSVLKEWEYKTVRLNPATQNFEAELNAASRGGWRLFTVVPTEDKGLSGYSQYIFQRQRR
jgi:hypothetical protein